MTINAGKPFLVLIADDEPDILRLIQAAMKISGFDVEGFLTGSDLLERLKSGPAPDLILLDIMMPSLDGYEVCRQIRRNKDLAALPIVFLTAKTQGQDYVKGIAAGGTSYIEKPFDVDRLPGKISTFLPDRGGK